MTFFKKEALFNSSKKDLEDVLSDLKNDNRLLRDKALQKMRDVKSVERLLFET